MQGKTRKARAVSHFLSEMVTEDTTLVVSVHPWSSYDCANEEEESSQGQTMAAKQSPGVFANSVSSPA